MQGVIDNERLRQQVIDALVVAFGIRQQAINDLSSKSQSVRIHPSQ